MINFKYTFENLSSSSSDYFVRQFRMGGAFEVYSNDEVLIGRISKGEEGWEQLDGKHMSDELIYGIGTYIDDHKLWS